MTPGVIFMLSWNRPKFLPQVTEWYETVLKQWEQLFMWFTWFLATIHVYIFNHDIFLILSEKCLTSSQHPLHTERDVRNYTCPEGVIKIINGTEFTNASFNEGEKCLRDGDVCFWSGCGTLYITAKVFPLSRSLWIFTAMLKYLTRIMFIFIHFSGHSSIRHRRESYSSLVLQRYTFWIGICVCIPVNFTEIVLLVLFFSLV